jgi:hypothetical protein
MFGLYPHVNLLKINDDISSSEIGYSFISCPDSYCLRRQPTLLFLIVMYPLSLF